MRDVLEEELANRLRELGDLVPDEIAPPVDLELQVQRRRRHARTTRTRLLFAVAAGVVVAAASAAVVQRSGGGGGVRIASSSTTNPAPAPIRDSLQAGTVMLSARGRFVISLNASGHQTATMVSAPPTSDITYARVTADHRALWYLSAKDGPKACADVVRANIDGKSSKIITKAVAFDISPDGTRLALYGAGNLADGHCSPVPAGTKGEIAVVDVATFQTSTLAIGDVSGLRWSPDGTYLAVTSCPVQGCSGVGRIDVPTDLGAPLVLTAEERVFSPNPVVSKTLVFGPRALYALERRVASVPPVSSPGLTATDTIERYDPTTLSAPVSIFAGANHWSIAEIVPTRTALYVVATPVVAAPGTSPALGSPGLYRLVGGRLVLVRTLSGPGTLTPVAPFVPAG